MLKPVQSTSNLHTKYKFQRYHGGPKFRNGSRDPDDAQSGVERVRGPGHEPHAHQQPVPGDAGHSAVGPSRASRTRVPLGAEESRGAQISRGKGHFWGTRTRHPVDDGLVQSLRPPDATNTTQQGRHAAKGQDRCRRRSCCRRRSTAGRGRCVGMAKGQ